MRHVTTRKQALGRRVIMPTAPRRIDNPITGGRIEFWASDGRTNAAYVVRGAAQ